MLVFASLFWLAGCSRDESTAENSTASPPEQAPKSLVLAYVNGTPITEDDAQNALRKLFSDRLPQGNEKQVKQRILESLISSRALSLLAREELDDEEKAQLETRVNAYREELLVQGYLSRHASPEPVSSDRVKRYYDDHPEAFGGGTSKQFDMIQTYRPVTEKERKELLEKLSELKQVADWSQWVEAHKTLPVNLRQLTARVEVLEQPLQSLVSATDVGETSPLHIGDTLTLVRVNGIERHPPKPLAQVSAEIRKRLAPIKMRATIKQLADEALTKAKVEIVSEKQSNGG
jgi:hypothetical protein